MANPLICVFNPVTSLIDEVQSISIGPAASGIPVVTNLLGVIDTSLLGIGTNTIAGQTIGSGVLVNLYSFGGTLHAQIASAQNGGGSPPAGPYPLAAQGFAATSASISQSFTVSFFGTFKYVDGNSEFGASNIGQEVFLSDRGDGSPTLTPPSGGGELEQSVGYVTGFVSPNIVTINFASGFQDFTHISGVNPVSKGGTGATTGAQALINLIGGSPAVNQALIWNGSAWVPGSDTAAFSQIQSGTNVSATMTVGTGAVLSFSGSGTVNANQLTGDPVNTSGRTTGQALVWNGTTWVPSSAAITAFNDLTSGTNTAATMTVGSGASIVVTGSGVVEATQLWNVLVSSTPPTAGQVLQASSGVAAAWATFTATPGGTNREIQFNNAGAFGGMTAQTDSNFQAMMIQPTGAIGTWLTPPAINASLVVYGDNASSFIMYMQDFSGAAFSTVDSHGSWYMQPNPTTSTTHALQINGDMTGFDSLRITFGGNGNAESFRVQEFGTVAVQPNLSPSITQPALKVYSDKQQVNDIAQFFDGTGNYNVVQIAQPLSTPAVPAVTIMGDNTNDCLVVQPKSATATFTIDQNGLGDLSGSVDTAANNNPESLSLDIQLTNSTGTSSPSNIGIAVGATYLGSANPTANAVISNSLSSSLVVGNTDSILSIHGLDVSAQSIGTAAIGSIIGLNSTSDHAGIGICTTLAGVAVKNEAASQTATVTNVYGVWVQSPTGFSAISGTINAALRIDDPTAGTYTDTYAIYVAGGVSQFTGVATAIVTKTTTYTATINDHTINCNGTFTLTLPTTGIAVGQEYYIKNIGTGTITVSSSVNIDGSLTQSLSVQYQSITVQWDGTQYWIY
jgi:hypothetical protein